MTRECEIGRHEALYGVAVLATIFVGGTCKLAFVNVCVTVQAELIFHAVLRRFAGWTVTLVAGHGSVLSQERIRALRVGGNRKHGRFPAFYFVAACAFALVRP